VISRNALISILVLMAGLIAGYFAFRLSSNLPVFSMQETGFIPWMGDWEAAESSEQKFFGSSLELSHLYEATGSDFQEVLQRASHDRRQISLQKDLLLQARDTLDAPSEELDRQISQLEFYADLLSLVDYYTRFALHYYHWMDSGQLPSSVDYKLAMGQFRATVAYHRQKYLEDADPGGMDLEALLQGMRVAEQTDRSVRWARVVTVILLFMLLMGIPRFIRDRGYRKFAGSLYFDAMFRPNKVSDLNAWHSIPRLALAMVLLYFYGGVILSSFVSWLLPLVLGIMSLFPVVFLILVMDNARKTPEVMVSLMAPKVLILAGILGVVAVRGPMFFWFHFWVSPVFRLLFMGAFGLLYFHQIHVYTVLARKWSHRNRRGAASMVGMALGLQYLACAAILLAFGPEKTLAALNRDLNLLPAWGADAPGISNWLGWSPGLPAWVMLFAGFLGTMSLVVFLFNKKALIPAAPSSRG